MICKVSVPDFEVEAESPEDAVTYFLNKLTGCTRIITVQVDVNKGVTHTIVVGPRSIDQLR